MTDDWDIRTLLKGLFETVTSRSKPMDNRMGIPGIPAYEQRDKEEFVTIMRDLYDQVEKTRSPSRPMQHFYEAVNAVMADTLKNIHPDESDEHKRYMTYFASGALRTQAERRGRNPIPYVRDPGVPAPEEGIRTGIATLLQDAQNKSKPHKAAIEATASEIYEALEQLETIQRQEAALSQAQYSQPAGNRFPYTDPDKEPSRKTGISPTLIAAVLPPSTSQNPDFDH